MDKDAFCGECVIVPVDETNIAQAAQIHSASWQASHRAFCSEAFIALHTPEHQRAYIEAEMRKGAAFYLLIADRPTGVVSVNGGLIENLYVLPGEQNKGYGTRLLRFAVARCARTPTLFILDNNDGARRLYERFGFRLTGRANAIAENLSELELRLDESQTLLNETD